MSLKERVYSVLLVSSSETINKAVFEMLPDSKCDTIQTVSNISSAKRMLAEREFDLIIVNSPLPDDDGLRFSVDAGSERNTVVMLMVRAEQYEETFERAARFGVFLLSKPVPKSAMELALNWISIARERLRMTEKKVLSFEEKMDEIKAVNRAKWLLISELKLSEPDAHRYIEKQAMDRCVPKRQIAEEIIKTYS